MIDFPESTCYGRRVPKQKFYEHLDFTPRFKKVFNEQIDCVIWRNKIAPTTLNVSEGADVKEIQVLVIRLKQGKLDKQTLSFIDRGIPYHLIFVLERGEEAQAWLGISGAYYNTEWLPRESLKLRIEGLDLDAVYDNFARQIADERLGTDGDIDEAVERDKRRQKLERDIAALEKKLQREKQFSRQVELNDELRRLRKELGGLV